MNTTTQRRAHRAEMADHWHSRGLLPSPQSAAKGGGPPSAVGGGDQGQGAQGRDEVPVALVFAADGTMPKPRRRDGQPPCGECHLPDGEVCDICGAHAEPTPVDHGAHIQAYAEGSAAAMAGVDWCANPYRQSELGAEWKRGWQEQATARVARELDDGVITRDAAARWLEGGWPHEPAPERQGPRPQGDGATRIASCNADTAGPGAGPAA